MANRVCLVFMYVLVGLAVACSGGDRGPQPCGTVTCNERQLCASAQAALCTCRPEYTGTDCSSCARGYIAAGGGRCTPIDIDCTANPGVCGSRGVCEKGATGLGDRCRCQTGYAGNACTSCDDGYQDNDRNGTCTAACGPTTCGAPQTCADSTGTARCTCPGNRTGAACDQCPTGWMLRASDGVCVQTCAASGTSCGTKKTCDPTQGICVCRAEYAGELCDTCAPGYQDNDRNGTCTASCAMTTCTAGQTCADTTGTARCACPPNRTGANCADCLSGWVLRASDNTCVQTCASLQSCGARRYCDESQGTPVCNCQTGFTGADCATCAPGFTSDGAGQCVRPAPAGTTLLGAGRFENGEYLLAIDPATGTATPLRQLAGVTNQRLTTDRASRSVFGISSSAISRIDLGTGKLTALATLQSVGSAAFGGGSLYTLGQLSPYLLKRVDPTSGAVADIGPTNLASGQGAIGLAWEPAGTLLYARPPVTDPNGADLYRIDPATAMVTMLGPLAMAGTGLRPSDNRVGLSYDSGGKLFLATRVGRTAEAIVAEHCRKLAAGLGYPGYEAAPLTSIEVAYNGIGAGVTRILNSKNASGKEIVAYASYGRRTTAKAALRVETANPDTLVCLSTYEEVLELMIQPASAKFAAIVLTGTRPTLTLVVEGMVAPVTRPTLHVYGGSGSVIAPAFNGAAGGYQFSKLYTATEWNNLRLPSYASAWDSDQAAPSVLVEVDPGTRAVVRTMSFPGVELFPTIAPWAP
jgi:hypothetical protein